MPQTVLEALEAVQRQLVSAVYYKLKAEEGLTDPQLQDATGAFLDVQRGKLTGQNWSEAELDLIERAQQLAQERAGRGAQLWEFHAKCLPSAMQG
jgi:hypothetical protein